MLLLCAVVSSNPVENSSENSMLGNTHHGKFSGDHSRYMVFPSECAILLIVCEGVVRGVSQRRPQGAAVAALVWELRAWTLL